MATAGMGEGELMNDQFWVHRVWGEPKGAQPLEELGVPREAVESQHRCVGELLHMQSHREHASELEEGFPGGCVEAASNYLDHVIMDSLKHVDECLGSVRLVP